MNLTERHISVISQLLSIEHKAIAQQIGFIPTTTNVIDNDLLLRTVSMLDGLSRIDEERARKIVVTISAILWTYRNEHWDGLKDYLVLILSRVGFPPSAIMIDEEYDEENQQFSELSSFVNQFNVTIHQFGHEIFVGRKKFLVTRFQKQVWDKLNELKLLGISAPTSAGKSFIILLKSIEAILNGKGNVIYIVPTLSLVAQVAADFNEKLKEFGLTNYRIATTYSSHNPASNKIYVLTQEKAISAFSQSDEPFTDVRVLVVDEIQNIEKVANENDQRAKTLYDTLIEFRHTCNPDLTIISGPRVEGLKQLGIDIFSELQADEEKTKDSPVASITYAISKSGNIYFLNQYTDVLEEPNRIQIVDDSIIEGYGTAQYRDRFISYLATFINNLGPGARNIIFQPTTAQARKTALKLSEFREPSGVNAEVDSLLKYLRDTVHEQYDMCDSISRGFVYHHGKTPTHVRTVIERAVRDRLIPNVVCTTTLMQGVNLPAQNVIVRNPDLSIRARDGVKPKLTDYEIANLRGRAGRLLKDFIGRTFILEQDSFERSDTQLELFPEAEKTLKSGYGEKFNEFHRQIHEGLESRTPPSSENQGYAYLMTYIRQTLLKHPNNADQRLNAVGINIEDVRLTSIKESLNQLSVPKEVCFKNRYWDPIDLEELYQKRNSFALPTSVADFNIEESLQVALERMSSEFPFYYNKHFKVNENLLQSACISAKEWLKEKPLKEILGTNYFNTAERIESRISLLQREISYGLPMLLKPIYDIKHPENMFLRFIEIGAYMPITRKMIELNIPRETAIYIANQYFNQNDFTEEHIEDDIVSRLRDIKESLDYWIRIQIDGII